MTKVPETPYTPGDGARSAKSTNVFRVVNFELYAKPVSVDILFLLLLIIHFITWIFSLKNFVVMALGLVGLTSTLGYIAYMRSKYESQGYYVAIQNDGTEVFTKKRSKWD